MLSYFKTSIQGLICNVPGDVIFVLDGSDSIQPNDWIRQRNFVANLIDNLEVCVRSRCHIVTLLTRSLILLITFVLLVTIIKDSVLDQYTLCPCSVHVLCFHTIVYIHIVCVQFIGYCHVVCCH